MLSFGRMNVRRLDDGSAVYFDAQGLIQSFPAESGVVHHARRGIIGAPFAPHVIADCERALKDFGRCILMVDGYETKMHTTEFRELLTDWFRAHEKATVHMLIRSRMLEMALNVANMVMGVGRARAYYAVDEWEAQGQQAWPSFRRRPIAPPADFERA
jgi:hypothetical protein